MFLYFIILEDLRVVHEHNFSILVYKFHTNLSTTFTKLMTSLSKEIQTVTVFEYLNLISVRFCRISLLLFSPAPRLVSIEKIDLTYI